MLYTTLLNYPIITIMDKKNENDFLELKNYNYFLIDLGLNISFHYKKNETQKTKEEKILKSVKDVDDYVKDWQKKNNYNLILRNKNVTSKSIILLSEKHNFIKFNQSKKKKPELLEKMFNSIGQNLDDFFIINIDLSQTNDDCIKKINSILELYFTILKPNIFIDITSKNLKNIFNIFNFDLNITYFKIPSILQIIENQSLKREAWSQLKLIRAKLNEI